MRIKYIWDNNPSSAAVLNRSIGYNKDSECYINVDELQKIAQYIYQH